MLRVYQARASARDRTNPLVHTLVLLGTRNSKHKPLSTHIHTPRHADCTETGSTTRLARRTLPVVTHHHTTNPRYRLRVQRSTAQHSTAAAAAPRTRTPPSPFHCRTSSYKLLLYSCNWLIPPWRRSRVAALAARRRAGPRCPAATAAHRRHRSPVRRAQNLKGAHQRLINAHHCPRIVELSTVVRCTKNRHQLPPREELVAILHDLGEKERKK